MSNRSSSKQHGHAMSGIQRPKSKLRSRKNKINAGKNRVVTQKNLASIVSTAEKALGSKF